ncbi:MAG: hypothetical protein ABL919_12110, partial [Methylococcales bacterium]
MNLIRNAYFLLKNIKSVNSIINIIQCFFNYIYVHINKFSILLMLFGFAVLIYYGFYKDYNSYVNQLNLPIWYAELHKVYRIEEALSIILAGLIIYFRLILLKPTGNNPLDVINKHANRKISSVIFFGVTIDFVVLQT